MAPVLEHVLICEDIRLEINNKITLVGVYGRYLFLARDAKFPGRLPQLCLFTRWLGIQGGEKVFLGLEYEGEVLLKPGEPNVAPNPNVATDYAQLSFMLPGFVLKGFGDYRFRISLNDAENVINEFVLSIQPQPSPPIPSRK